MASKKKRGAAKKARKKAAAKKTARKRTPSRKPPVRKKAGKKAVKKKAAAKKAPRKKAPRKKAARKKAARKKAAGRGSPARAKKKAKSRKAPSKRARPTGKRPARRPRAVRGREFYDHFRQRLLDQRQQITSRLVELRDELSGLEQAPPRELEEWAQEEKDRDILIRLEERETDELRRIQAALALIDAGEYGVCQNCGKPIPRARLEELPTAFRCIDCTP